MLNRDDARSLGLKRYFSGLPCRVGHISERYVSTGGCIECHALARRAYADAFPEEVKRMKKDWQNRESARMAQHTRNWRARNPEKDKAKQKKWAAENPEKVSARAARYYRRHRARKIADATKWAKNNPERACANWRNARARKANAPGKFSAIDIRGIAKAQGGRCAYCAISLRRTRRHIDHIVALSKGGTNYPKNLQLLCAPCNQSKSAKDPVTFAQSLGRLL